jgi:stage II sporulation protein P
MRKISFVVLVITLIVGVAVLIQSDGYADELQLHERTEGYYTVKDEKTDEVIFATALYLFEGDQYLTQDNRLYEITKIESDTAYAKMLEKVDLSDFIKSLDPKALDLSIQTSSMQSNKRVGIYFTHSDESYVPTDGTSSIPGKGGIFDVGNALTVSLREQGVQVYKSSAAHDPHDAGAYQRSRRTAQELSRKRLDALLDIHRDAVPPQYYLTRVRGTELAQVQMVVGRQNPNRQVNDNFARQLKAVADKIHPGLVKGIFYGKGDYNQDLGPRTMLLEIGTHTVPKEKAEEGARHFADVITRTLYGADQQKKTGIGGSSEPIRGEGSSIGRSLLTIIGIVLVGFVGYMLISGGSWNEISSKIKKFATREMANFLGKLKKK